MIEILPESTASCIGFKVSGKIVAEDYDVLLTKADEAIAEYETINLLVLMGDFKGVKGFDAVKADFEFGTQEYRQVEKAAFVGEKKWQEWMIKIIDPFTRRTDERFFELEKLDEAWSWIKGN
jgi:hypothetical protein